MNKICVLIPSYNESKTIGDIVHKVKALGLTACVIDDGSTDNTGSIAASEGAVVIANKANMGKGAALRSGFAYILNNDYDAVIIIDGDGQHEVSSIPDFIKSAEDTKPDIIIGNRMSDTRAMPYVRRQTNRFMSWLISRMCGQKIPDTQCGYRLINRKVLESVALSSSNFEIESELIIRSSRKGFIIGSVPIKTVYQNETSRINPIVDTLRFIAFVFKMKKEK
ncbi:MAG: glycosyltransferase family 2 protein [Candidatus Omnitrophota bacterium]